MKIDGLFVYPLKSARAIATGRAMVTPLGLAADRRAMLVDPAGVFITQREMPEAFRLYGRLRTEAAGSPEVDGPPCARGSAHRPPNGHRTPIGHTSPS